MKQKIAVTGSSGMLGSELMRSLAKDDGRELIGLTKDSCDITRDAHVREAFRRIRPSVVIHCAAFTAVDVCESERNKAWDVNARGTENVAEAAQSIGARLIHISTDYVFDGKLDRPYHEFDPAGNPLNVYGQTKWAAEEAVRTHHSDALIARVSWLFGNNGVHFVDTMLRLARQNPPTINVVDDQLGNPTSTRAVASALDVLLKHPELAGTIHLSCEGEASWFSFAQKIFALTGIRQNVLPCASTEFSRPAQRPANSRLEKRVLKETGLYRMPHWEEALKDFLNSK